jgi:hypothetical protein
VSTLVNAVLWDADGSRPLNIEPWAMYEVPRVGERYWHHRTGFVVREFVDNLAPPELHLVREPGWEEEVRAGLPAEYILEGSRRDGRRARARVPAPRRPHGQRRSRLTHQAGLALRAGRDAPLDPPRGGCGRPAGPGFPLLFSAEAG